jgi:hypothetical protein
MAAPLLSSALLMACLSEKSRPGAGRLSRAEPPPADQAQHQVVFGQAARQVDDALRRLAPGLVGHRMGRASTTAMRPGCAW